jgi:hypothetical protein
MYASKQATAYMSGAKINSVGAAGVPQRRQKKQKGINRMFKWFARKLRDAQRDLDRDYEVSECVPSTIGRERSSDERITLRLERAIGGHIVSVSKYNSRIDRHSENTYLIRDDDSLEEALTAVFIQEKMSQ